MTYISGGIVSNSFYHGLKSSDGLAGGGGINHPGIGIPSRDGSPSPAVYVPKALYAGFRQENYLAWLELAR
jgi:hypothetical protein